jgi:hypothetical protein
MSAIETLPVGLIAYAGLYPPADLDMRTAVCNCQWTTNQVRTIRQEFFTSYGSCSFVEPLQDLEALRWL